MASPKIMIASPTPGSVKTLYMVSVMATMDALASEGIQCRFETCDGSDIPQQRNHLATRFLATDSTHLLWIDSDMGFGPDVCLTMIRAGKPFIGTIYAAKKLSDVEAAKAAVDGLAFQDAALCGQPWLSFPVDPDKIVVQDGLMEVAFLGLGLTLVNRVVLERMVAENVAPKYRSQPGGENYNFFGLRPEQASEGRHISEDHSFCLRWTKDCGGKIWAFTPPTIFHVGDFSYGGSFLRYLHVTQARTNS